MKRRSLTVLLQGSRQRLQISHLIAILTVFNVERGALNVPRAIRAVINRIHGKKQQRLTFSVNSVYSASSAFSFLHKPGLAGNNSRSS
jgi:hypothetical protein